MSDPDNLGWDAVTWETLTWQDIQAAGMALAERHPGENILTLSPERLTHLVEALPGFAAGAAAPDDFTLSAIVTAWIAAEEGEDDSSPFDSQA